MFLYEISGVTLPYCISTDIGIHKLLTHGLFKISRFVIWKRLFNKKKFFEALGLEEKTYIFRTFSFTGPSLWAGQNLLPLDFYSYTQVPRAETDTEWCNEDYTCYHIASFAFLGSCRTGLIYSNFLHTMWEATEQQEISCNRYHVTDIRFIPTRNCPRFSFPWHQTCHRKIYHLYCSKLSCNSPWQFWSKLPW